MVVASVANNAVYAYDVVTDANELGIADTQHDEVSYIVNCLLIYNMFSALHNNKNVKKQ